MIEFVDHIPGEGMAGRRKITYEDGRTEFVTIQNADEAIEDGTDINRKTLMAMQGFVSATTTFNDDGTITEVNMDGQTMVTTFTENGLTEVFTGDQTIAKTTTFNADGTISEVVL